MLRRLAATGMVLAAATGLAACGDDDEGSSGASSTTASVPKTTTAPPTPRYGIKVVYDEPRNPDQAQAQELLKLGGTDGVAAGFTKNFAFPTDLTIHASNEPDGSPHYDPSTKTVTLYYDFVIQTGNILRQNQPNITDSEFGKQIAAVDGFILVHELGHAFVDVFQIPITGREEDSVDGMATVFMADAVKGGTEYAFDAARFFKFLQDTQGAPDAQQFADEHSLSIQRALDIVCSVAGSTPQAMQDIERLEILPPARLQRCPAEYQQKSRAWKTLLKPHLRSEQ